MKHVNHITSRLPSSLSLNNVFLLLSDICAAFIFFHPYGSIATKPDHILSTRLDFDDDLGIALAFLLSERAAEARDWSALRLAGRISNMLVCWRADRQTWAGAR